MHHVRLFVAVNQGLGDVQQTARQREGANNACEHRTILNHAHDLLDRVNINLGASCSDFRYRERLRLLHALVLLHLSGDDRSGHGRHLVVRKTDGCSEALCLERKIPSG